MLLFVPIHNAFVLFASRGRSGASPGGGTTTRTAGSTGTSQRRGTARNTKPHRHPASSTPHSADATLLQLPASHASPFHLCVFALFSFPQDDIGSTLITAMRDANRLRDRFPAIRRGWANILHEDRQNGARHARSTLPRAHRKKMLPYTARAAGPAAPRCDSRIACCSLCAAWRAGVMAWERVFDGEVRIVCVFNAGRRLFTKGDYGMWVGGGRFREVFNSSAPKYSGNDAVISNGKEVKNSYDGAAVETGADMDTAPCSCQAGTRHFLYQRSVDNDGVGNLRAAFCHRREAVDQPARAVDARVQAGVREPGRGGAGRRR